MLQLSDVILAFLALAGFAWWWRIGAQKSRALDITARQCARLELQLLDQTLAFRRHRLLTDARGRKRLCRVYEFDFCSDGEDRRSGEIAMAGLTLLPLRMVLETDTLEVIEF